MATTHAITLAQVLAVVDAAYGDEVVARYAAGEDGGDTLAEFLTIELRETYEDEPISGNAYDLASYYVENAIRDLDRVLKGLIKASEAVS